MYGNNHSKLIPKLLLFYVTLFTVHNFFYYKKWTTTLLIIVACIRTKLTNFDTSIHPFIKYLVRWINLWKLLSNFSKVDGWLFPKNEFFPSLDLNIVHTIIQSTTKNVTKRNPVSKRIGFHMFKWNFSLDIKMIIFRKNIITLPLSLSKLSLRPTNFMITNSHIFTLSRGWLENAESIWISYF